MSIRAQGSFVIAWIGVAAAGTLAGCGPESDDGDNSGSDSIAEAIASPAPDYVVSQLTSPPAAAVNGARFDLTVKVVNAGDGNATTVSTTRFFLSLDRVVGSRAFAQAAIVPALAIGASDTQTVTLVIPTGLPSGSYFVLACADGRKNIPELHENNNCAASAGAVAVTGPDLIVEALSDPPDIEETFAITDTTRNRGTANASSSLVGYYLSPVPSLGTDSVRLVVRRDTGPIAAGGASTGTVTAAVPALPAGSYYVIACADLSAQVPESDETNNCTTSAATGVIGPPDLVVSALAEPPAGLAAGDTFSVADAVANLGHHTTPESILQFFLSQDELPGGDIALDRSRTRAIRELPGGETSSAVDELTVDPTTPPGDYFLLACADVTGTVAEDSESNNCRVSTTRVTVTATTCGDLQVTGAEQCDDGNLIDDDGCDRDCKPTAVVQVVNGAAHTCARMRSGGVRCWGSGLVGQLGNGSTVSIGDNETPASVPDVDVGGKVVQLAAGYYHTCAILAGGALRCWGSGYYGNLGYGDVRNIGDDETPASAGNVNLGGPAAGITAGPYHTCALLEGGTVRCWGDGNHGRLGYASLATVYVPASAGDVAVGGTVVQVAAAHRHTCALLDTGKVRCWGASGVPAGDVDVGGTVVQVDAGGDATCALLETGAVRCWGSGRFGALGYPGRGDVVGSGVPASVGDVDVGGIVAEVEVGDAYTCVRLTTGSIRCWGKALFGQLGYGNRNIIGDNETPASAGDVNIGGSAVGIATGVTHTCVLLTTGDVRCWGQGTDGRLGYGNTLTIGDNEVPASVGPVDVY